MQIRIKVYPSIILLLMATLFCFSVQAQQTDRKLLKGVVVDNEDGEFLVGVHVQVKEDKKRVAVTDKDGKFSIRAAATETLVFTYIGYTAQQVQVSSFKETVRLKQSITGLNEIVIVGYGEVKRKDITGAVAEVKMEDLAKAPVASFDEALAGRIAGVQVSSNEGQPGAEMNIVVRGGNSLTQSNSPLYVIDGFPIEDFSNAAINTDDIASISVLKDASATAIYGSRGANGVIIIETKKGKTGGAVISYNGYAGVQNVTKEMELMNPYEFVKYQTERDPDGMVRTYFTNPGFTLEDYENTENIDWPDMLFRTALMQNHNLSIRGGSEQTKYAFSGSIFGQNGVIINSGYDRYQGRVVVDQTINKKLKIGININYSKDKNYGALSSAQAASSRAYSTYLMYRVWGYRPLTIGNDFDAFNDLFDSEEEDNRIMNPIIGTKNELRQQFRTNIMTNAYATYAIRDNLTLNIRGGLNSRLTRNESFNNSKTFRGFPSASNLKGVNGSFSDLDLNDWVNENTLTYKKKLNKDNSFDITAGFTIQGTSASTYGYESTNIPNEELGLVALQLGIPSSVTSFKSRNTLMSYLGRVNYNFKSRYLFTASFRADGSSKFAPENRWGYFPSVAFAWQMGKEKFLKKLSFVSDAKFRVSYGVTGNNRVNDFVRYLSLNLTDYYSFANEIPAYAATIDNLGNDHLKWERTTQADIGYDLSLFKNRINLAIDLYSKTTSDLLLNSNLPNSSGFNKVYKNVGKIRNNGLELSLSTVNIKTKAFSWQSDFNISFNNNKILALADGETNILSTVNWTGDFANSYLYLARIGGPAASFFGYVWDGNYQYEDFDLQQNGTYKLKNTVPTNGNDRSVIKPGDIKYVDQNGDGVLNDQDRVVIGRALPIHTGGFNNNFTYKGFNLNVFFQWNYGNDIYNANRIIFEGNFTNRQNLNQYATYQDRWTPENQSNTQFRIGGQGPAGVYSSRTIEDGSFLRLKTVQLGYTFPKPVMKQLKMKSIELYVAAQNLYTWTNYSGMDPEVSVRNSTLTPGLDYSAYARNRTITMGVKATF